MVTEAYSRDHGSSTGGNDLDRVVGWMTEGRLVNPRDPLPTIVDLVRAVLRVAGMSGATLTAPSRALAERIGGARHVVFILIDGLGTEVLQRIAPCGGFLMSHTLDRVRTVFPSTTAAAMTSLVTGMYPSEHGITGWWIYLAERDLTATVLPFVERFSGRDLQQFGIGAAEIFVAPSLLPELDRSVLTITPRPFLEDTFLRYSTGGTPASGYETPAEALSVATRHILSSSRPTYTSVYLPHVDEACHSLGLDSPEVAAGLQVIDEALSSFRASLNDDVRIIVTGDHGHVPLSAERVYWLDSEDPLLELLVCPPSGEPTLPYLYRKDGIEQSALRAEFRERYGEAFALISREDAGRLGLYGPSPPSELTRSRIGDLIGIAPEPTGLYFRRAGEDVTVHRSVHAGLTSGEMLVPVIVA